LRLWKTKMQQTSKWKCKRWRHYNEVFDIVKGENFEKASSQKATTKLTFSYVYAMQCFFVFWILWCYHIGDHPKGDLTTFGYQLVMKVEIY
jgi:hypothetical protein